MRLAEDLSNKQGHNTSNMVSEQAIDYLNAWNYLASGELEEADRLLRKNGKLPDSVVALDLLARIAVQKGCFDEAKILWEAVLEKDPHNEAAKAAIKKLKSPWLSISLIKRTAILLSLVIVLYISILGILTFFKENQKKEQQPTITIISVPGSTVQTKQNETTIIFDEGLFSHGCFFKNAANKKIETLAHLLKKNSANSRILIEGHTDSYAVRQNSLYKNNYELGLQRALSVAKIIKNKHQIEGERIIVTSMGDKNLPYPEVDHLSMLKNRTVVIRLF